MAKNVILHHVSKFIPIITQYYVMPVNQHHSTLGDMACFATSLLPRGRDYNENIVSARDQDSRLGGWLTGAGASGRARS